MKGILLVVAIFVIIIGGVLITRAKRRVEMKANPKGETSSTYRGLDLAGKPEKLPAVKTMSEKILEGKKIAMVIAFRDFRNEEYFVPKEILEKAGAEIKTASNKKGKAIGADGGEVDVDLLVSEVNPAEFADLQSKSSHDSIQSISSFDAVVFVGGPGCLENLDNENSYNLVKETVAKNRLLASICVSPVILAKAGVLKNKSATVWSNALDKSAIEILEQNGANYQAQDVVVDGKIITANGPDAARKFADTLIGVLK